MTDNNIGTQYELDRVSDSAQFYKKMVAKRLLFKLFGETYVGRRIKFAHFRCWLNRIPIPTTAKIMEAGSGDGVFSFFVAQKFKSAAVLGIELNAVEAEICQNLAIKERISNLRFQSGSLYEMKWKEQFDFIYCLDVLEHIPDDVHVLKEIQATLKSGGSLLVHVPNRSYLETDGRMITLPDEEAWKVNPGHVRQGYAPDELAAKLEQAGFEVISIEHTQGKAASYAYKLYAKVEKMLPLRVLVLPIIDVLNRIDMKRLPAHGNTVWGWARKPPTNSSSA